MPNIDSDKVNEVFQIEGTGPSQSKDDATVFHRACLEWLRTWVAKRGMGAAGTNLCVFIFRLDEVIQPFSGPGKALPAFRISHLKKLGGRVFFCSADLSVVIEGAGHNAAELPAVCEWLTGNATGQYAAVAFDIELLDAFVIEPTDFEQSIVVSIKAPASDDFKWSELDELLSAMYIRHLMVPSAHHCLWADEVTRKLQTQPEKKVQMLLYWGLFAAIEHRKIGTVGVEIDNPKGREDVEVKVFRDGKYELGIIELKVLRADKGVDWNSKWALGAIKQAIDYAQGSVHPVARKLACCFDGRKEDAAIPEFFTEATKQEVDGRRYFMESTGIARKYTDYTT